MIIKTRIHIIIVLILITVSCQKTPPTRFELVITHLSYKVPGEDEFSEWESIKLKDTPLPQATLDFMEGTFHVKKFLGDYTMQLSEMHLSETESYTVIRFDGVVIIGALVHVVGEKYKLRMVAHDGDNEVHWYSRQIDPHFDTEKGWTERLNPVVNVYRLSQKGNTKPARTPIVIDDYWGTIERYPEESIY